VKVLACGGGPTHPPGTVPDDVEAAARAG
jgi:hypothetical protein